MDERPNDDDDAPSNDDDGKYADGDGGGGGTMDDDGECDSDGMIAAYAKPATMGRIRNLEGYFVYHGREDEIVPRDVIRVRVHPSVKVIRQSAFEYQYQLTTVILNDGLEEIGKYAFEECSSLQRIDVPPTVKSIKKGAFSRIVVFFALK
jgi:hypothetical protein